MTRSSISYLYNNILVALVHGITVSYLGLLLTHFLWHTGVRSIDALPDIIALLVFFVGQLPLPHSIAVRQDGQMLFRISFSCSTWPVIFFSA